MARKRKKRRRRKRRVRWTDQHVRRLFWRAGFGATAEEVDRWAGRGRTATLDWIMTGDGKAELKGPPPSANGKPLDRENVHGHDVLWWLDRMVRTTRPLEEKMTLFWHDRFATRDIERPLMLRQNEVLRANALGDFDTLLREITLDPAMQGFLNLLGSHKKSPNENFARELMELFTLGSGYTEEDIREASRALTGFVGVYRNGRLVGARFEPSRHDDGVKTIFGKSGNFGWRDVLDLCLGHPNHAPFLVGELWSFFIPTPIADTTRAKLVKVYLDSGRNIAPLVRRILDHPHLYADLDHPTQVKWPAVYVAGQLRMLGAPVDRYAWTYLTASMGQQLFAPPSVAGWEWNAAWLSSNAMRARFMAANELIYKNGPIQVRAGTIDPDTSAEDHLRRAIDAVGRPHMSRSTRLVLNRLIAAAQAAPEASHKDVKVRRRHTETLQRTLRHLLVSGPENQVC